MKTISKIKNETFTIEKALNRLQWRFKNENVKINESKIVINELDQKAVDFLIQWHQKQKEESLHENLLFAKIYCYALKIELQHFRDIKIALNSMETNLKLPIEYHYEKIVFELNSQILEDYEDFLGLEKKHSLLRTKEEDEKIKELIKTDEKYSKLIMGFYEEKQIYTTIFCISR